MHEPIPGKLYVWKWDCRVLYETADFAFNESKLHTLKNEDVFLLLEHTMQRPFPSESAFKDVMFKIIAGETCGWILYDRFYANRPNSWDLIEEYAEPSS